MNVSCIERADIIKALEEYERVAEQLFRAMEPFAEGMNKEGAGDGVWAYTWFSNEEMPACFFKQFEGRLDMRLKKYGRVLYVWRETSYHIRYSLYSPTLIQRLVDFSYLK
jgi:hypothetical protein